MSTEIELKFLVNEIPRERIHEYDTIYQGYVAVTDRVEVRVRKIEPSLPPFDTIYTLTIKDLKDNFRVEVEKELTETEYYQLWKLCGDKLVKYRHHGLLKLKNEETERHWGFELDEYIVPVVGERFKLCEIEFKDEDDLELFKSFELPSWLGDDVTSDSRYKNRNISETIRKVK